MHELKTLEKSELPFLLQQINDPPKKLFVKGKLPEENAKILCVVGARQHSSYGEEACRKLIGGLRGQNICIVSGLALGIDAIAHRSALEIGLQTIAFPGSGLDEKILYPERNRKLADEILYSGGALLSEFDMDQIGMHWTFPQRNRLMAGISHATLVIEAELKSGTLITSRLATEYNREVGAVPGNIFSKLSEGPHMLIRLGATPITCSNNILEMLGLKTNDDATQSQLFPIYPNLNNAEQKIIDLLQIEPSTSEQLIFKSELPAKEVSEILSMLEIQDLIERNGGVFKIK